MLVVLLRWGYLRWAQLKEGRLLSPGTVPTAEELRTGATIASRGDRHFDWLIESLRRKAQAGVLQEEPIIDELEDRIVYGETRFQEFPAICILSALAWTFFNLKSNLPSIVNAGDVTPKSLAPILGLVGANWWLIFGGLLFHFGSLGERYLNMARFEAYRSWLEREIVPRLGVARTTGDRLTSALESFSTTVKEIREAVFPLSGLASVMQSFQEGLVAEMIPAMSKGLEGVKIGLSDAALGELQKTTIESTRALREMKDQQAKMLTLVISGERRGAELAALVQSISNQTGLAASALQGQTGLINLNIQALAGLKSEILTSTEGTRSLVNTILQLMASTISHTKQLETHNVAVSGLAALLPPIGGTLAEMRTLISGIQMGLASLAVSENGLRTEMEQSRAVVSAAAARLTTAIENAADLKQRWEEAMLQMTSLIDEISQRTIGFEKSAGELTAVAGVVASGLPGIQSTIDGVGAKVSALAGSTAEIAAGNKAIVSAFSDLLAASQKLKSLGHSITGHFNIWQDQTRKVYGKAQESTEKIEASFTRIGDVVSGMEGILKTLAERDQRDGFSLNAARERLAQYSTTELASAAATGDVTVPGSSEHPQSDVTSPAVI